MLPRRSWLLLAVLLSFLTASCGKSNSGQIPTDPAVPIDPKKDIGTIDFGPAPKVKKK